MKKEDIQRLIIEGPELGVALSIDTCIYEQNGYRFERGRLKHVEQFGAQPSTFLMSDVVRREVHAHMVDKATAAQGSLKKALSDIGEHWQVSEAERSSAYAALVGTTSADDFTESRLASFLDRCRAALVPSDGTVGMAALMDRYFSAHPPFEASGAKKHEFPDAVALMSLEEWSIRNRKPILLVSSDKGWQSFADSSSHLCCVDSLDVALEMFQRRDKTREDLVNHVASLLDSGPWEGLDELVGLLDGATWVEEASSRFDYDIDLEVNAEKVRFASEVSRESLKVIDYTDGELTVAASLVGDVHVYADFMFSMEDINLGGLSLSKSETVEFEAIITFANPGGAELVVKDMDLVGRKQTVWLGNVEPDYSGEDPTHEKY